VRRRVSSVAARYAEVRARTRKQPSITSGRLNENPDHERACFNLAGCTTVEAKTPRRSSFIERVTTRPAGAPQRAAQPGGAYEDNNTTTSAPLPRRGAAHQYNHQRARLYLRTWSRRGRCTTTKTSRSDRRNAVWIFRSAISAVRPQPELPQKNEHAVAGATCSRPPEQDAGATELRRIPA